jgi:hypothetical protein
MIAHHPSRRIVVPLMKYYAADQIQSKDAAHNTM